MSLYFEDVEVGDVGPEFRRTTDLLNWNRFAAVNDEFLYVHMDDAAGIAAGQGAAFGMGNLRFAYVLNGLRDWLGDEAEIRHLEVQFRKVNHKNDELSTYARVVEKSNSEGVNLVYLEVDVVNQQGEKTCPGHASVALPTRSKS